MNINEFKELSDELLVLLNHLHQYANSSIPTAINILSNNLPKNGVLPQQMCEMEIQKIGLSLQGLCDIHNKMYKSIDMQPIFLDQFKVEDKE